MKKFKLRRHWSSKIKKAKRLGWRRRWLKFYGGKFPKPRIPMPKFVLELWESRNKRVPVLSGKTLTLKRMVDNDKENCRPANSGAQCQEHTV